MKTVSVVCGALGTVGVSIDKYLNMICPYVQFKVIPKTALLGTGHILRNVLTKQGLK